MNLGDLKDRVFRLTNHLYTDIFHMRDLLNDALNQLTDKAKLLDGVASISVISGTSAYPLPVTFKAPFMLIEGAISEPTEVYELISIDEDRYGYAIYNGNLYIKPTPNLDKTLNLHYYKYATPLVNDIDTPEIDSQYHELLATYAAGMIMLLPDMKQFDKGLADRLLARWEEGKKSFRDSMQRKTVRTPVKIRTVW